MTVMMNVTRRNKETDCLLKSQAGMIRRARRKPVVWRFCLNGNLKLRCPVL